MKTIEGIYNNGKIKLIEKPNYKGQFRVLVQFMKFPDTKKNNLIFKNQSEQILANWQKTGKKMGDISLSDFVIEDRERH